MPTGLTATAGNTQVVLSWSASSGAANYNVKRATAAGGPYSPIGAPTAANFTDTGLANGTTYFYEVSAVDSAGESANSPAVSAMPISGVSVPAVPTGLTATSGNAQVMLSWTASAGATSYNVKRGTANGGPYTQIASPTTTSFTDTGLINGTTYYYVVSAVNSAGQSQNSAQASATPASGVTIPATPSGLTATAGNAQVSLSWSASTGATNYNVKRGTASGGPYTQIASPTTTSFTDTGLTNGTTYYYVVSAVNSAGQSANSSQASATPAASSAAIQVTVDVLSNRHPISQYIYGGSYPQSPSAITDSGLTVVRWGGNATSRYNWQTHTYNAANDYFYSDYLHSEIGDSDSAKFIQDVKAAGSNPLMTMVTMNWVSKGDPANNTSNGQLFSFSTTKYGAQCAVNPSTGGGKAGNGLKPDCTTPITGNDPNDANVELLDQPGASDPPGSVYRNQWAAALAAAFGSAPHFYDMDNESDIWGSTHRDIHPSPAAYDELRDVYLKQARNLKAWDPQAVRLGPVSCCWWFYFNGANNSDKAAHAGVDFAPWWLNEVYWQDQVAGSRSLDVFDIHAYPDSPNMSSFTLAQKQALAVSIYRDYWDPTYVSPSSSINQPWATQTQPNKTIPFRIPRMRAIVNSIYPGTPLSITEWSAAFAGESDFSTALGDADAYGILGRERVYLASRWTAATSGNPNYQAIKLYTNYDGQHHGFGTTSVSAKHNASPNLFSTYAALSSSGTTLTVMVLNKDPQNSTSVQFAFNGFMPSQVATYTLSQASPTSIVASAAKAWPSSLSFAPYSTALLVIGGSLAQTPGAEWDLNPDTVMIPAGGTYTLKPKLTSASGTITLGTPQQPSGITLAVTKSQLTASQNGSITVTAGNTPGFYPYTIPGTDNAGVAQNQSGWILVGNPAAILNKTGDNQTAAPGSTLTLSVNLSAGQSGGANPAQGGSIFFTTDVGALSSRIVTTDGSGNATVKLTLPSSAATVHVTAEGPYGLGHPVVTFTENAQ